MTVYYDDIVLLGTNYKPQWPGQNAAPGWADDIVYFASFPAAPAPGAGFREPTYFIANMGRMMNRRGG